MEEYMENRYHLYQKRAAVQAYLEALDYAIDQHNDRVRDYNLTHEPFRKIDEKIFEKYFVEAGGFF
jgi:hypothetical protein